MDFSCCNWIWARGPGPRALGPVGPLIAAARHIKLLYNIIAAVVGFLAAVVGFLAAVIVEKAGSLRSHNGARFARRGPGPRA